MVSLMQYAFRGDWKRGTGKRGTKLAWVENAGLENTGTSLVWVARRNIITVLRWCVRVMRKRVYALITVYSQWLPYLPCGHQHGATSVLTVTLVIAGRTLWSCSFKFVMWFKAEYQTISNSSNCNDLEGHFPIASLFKCDILYFRICEASCKECLNCPLLLGLRSAILLMQMKQKYLSKNTK